MAVEPRTRSSEHGARDSDGAAGAGGAELAVRRFQRILIVKPSSLGDVVHALPVLHGLRQRYPDAHLAWLVTPPFDALIRNHPDLDEVILFDRRGYGRMAYSPAAVLRFVRFIRELRRRRFDLVIDLQGLFRSGFLARATAAPTRLGHADARELAPLFYTHRLPRRPADTHAVDRNYAVAAMLGFADVPIRFDLALTDAERARADEMLTQAAPGSGPLIAIVPGARWETKRWPPEKFAQLLKAIAERRLGRCVLLGAPDERDVCARVAKAGSDTDRANLAGRTTMRELAALIGRCDIVICHDSAPLHLAVALDRRMLCITGPTNPHRTGPWRRPESVCRVPLDCSPCYYRRLTQCPHDHRCMGDLTVDHVLKRLEAALATA